MNEHNPIQILVINPGSTSTKVAWYIHETREWQSSVNYTPEDLRPFKSAIEQSAMRKQDIERILLEHRDGLSGCSAVAGRGGPFLPMESGTYRVTEAVLRDVYAGRVQADHISNTGVLLAHEFAIQAGVPAFFVDPVCVDEFEPLARYSGIPDLERRSLLHALNIKAVARRTAEQMNQSIDDSRFIIAHLGGGISICAMENGRMVDVNNANEEGPFSPERSGSLPSSSLVKLCYSRKYEVADLTKRLVGQGGLTAYLGTSDIREIWQWIDDGNHEAQLLLEAMAYQIAKEIGAMSAVLCGDVDAIILTGGMSHDTRLTGWIESRVSSIAEVRYMPGEFEMDALAAGVIRVLTGREAEKEYPYE